MPSVLITGSSKGLGKSLALNYAFNGYNVVLHGRDVLRLENVEKEVLRYGVSCQVVVGDITNESIISELVKCAKDFDIDILINNAGIYSQKPVDEMFSNELEQMIAVNLVAPIMLTKKVFLNHFRCRKLGLIININSIAGKSPGVFESAYCASKHGLKGFMESFQFEALKSGVSITNVYLGAMGTEMTSYRKDSDKFMKTKEVADLIYNVSKNYNSVRISEIEILRKLY